jgi:hypothetical protein
MEKLVLKGDYSNQDSIRIAKVFSKASYAVDEMHKAMNQIWNTDNDRANDKRAVRKEKWKNEPAFVEWLGEPEKLAKVNRRIKKTYTNFNRKITLVVTKENRGKCSGWISAWAIPFGKIRITLCEDFFIYRTHLQEKILIHEIGHEGGLLFHHKIHGCRAAKRAAATSKSNVAKRSTENYAWLAMSYLGLDCSNRPQDYNRASEK